MLCCFCHTTKQISHNYMYIPSFLSLPPPPHSTPEIFKVSLVLQFSPLFFFTLFLRAAPITWIWFFWAKLLIRKLFSFYFISESDSVSHSVMSDSLQLRCLQPTRLLCPWSSPGKNTGVGCHFLLQQIFLTQGPRSPALQVDSLPPEPLVPFWSV